MTENEPDYRTEETEVSSTPGAGAQMTTEAMANLEEVAADPLADKAAHQQAHERAMFERYVAEEGQKIPENFKDAGSWFESLKGAQSKFTQGQQEISDLKRQYNLSGGTNNPDYVPPATEPPADTPAPTVEAKLDELRIPVEEPNEEAAAETTEAPPIRVTEDDYNGWNVEVATTGSLSPESRSDLKAKTGFTEPMIDDFLAAQKAKRQAAFNTAAEVVGDGHKLSKILRWAATNYSGDQLVALQQGLAGASSELTLRGLTSAYDAVNVNAEPKRRGDTVSPATAQTVQLPGYKSMVEYSMDQSNPRYARDAKFRMAVDTRAARTDWRTLK